MGGVSVLLMIAAVGITYGWQPDNSGGVEYLIQIPPEQLQELERVGEISSVIDPAVRGRVSRVIVTVGDARLPRTMPPNLPRKAATMQPTSGVVAVSDHSPVPVPEMADANRASPIPSFDSSAMNAGDRDTTVMKPDASNPAGGPGFAFPSSLSDAAANGLRNGIDRAGREIVNGATGNTAVDPRGPLVAPPSTRAANTGLRTQAPQFTSGMNSRGDLAQTRAGGPSTDPTDTRINSWQDYSNRNLAGSRTGGPSTDPLGGSDQNQTGRTFAQNQNSTFGNPASNLRGAGATSPGDPFGRSQSGLTLPGGNDNRSNAYGDRNTQSDYGQGAYATQGSSFQNSNLQGTNATGVYSQQEQTRIDRQSTYARGQYSDASALGTQSVGANAGLSNPLSNYGQSSSPDPRLTAAERAAGAWSVDIYGNPIDQEGRLIPTGNATAAAVNYDPTRMQAQPQTGMSNLYADRATSSLGQPSADAPAYSAAAATGPNMSRLQNQYSYNPSSPTGADPNARLVRNANPTNGSELQGRNELDPRGEANRAGIVTRDPRLDIPSFDSTRRDAGAIGAGMQGRTVAAQPLFNGLLLISFVANVYLIFWLKNLRVQFRDLVAAKRIASGSSSPS